MRSRFAWRMIGLGLIGAGLVGCVSSGSGLKSGHVSNRSEAARVNVQLGVDYLQQGQLALAQIKLQRALNEDPHSADAHGAMALLDERLGESKDADREYRRALALSERAPSMLNNYAVYLCSHSRADEGVRDFEEAASNPLYPTPWVAYTNAGVCLRGVHRDQEAMARFARAQQSNPKYADAAFQASELDFTLQHYTPARTRLETYLGSNPPTPDLLLLGWHITHAQDDAVGQAVYAARLAMEFPNSPQAHELELAAAGSGPG